jgi:hypothetical protein
MSKEVDDVLAHHGVKGMKWGSHAKAKAANGLTGSQQRGFFNKPSAAKAIVLGSYGSKSSYTNPQALALRKQAGRLRIAAVLTGAGANLIGNASRGNVGGQAVSAILGTAAGGVQLASLVKGAQGASLERFSRGS